MSHRHQAPAMMALAVLTVSLGACFDPTGSSSGCFDFLSGEEVPCRGVVFTAKSIEVTTTTAGEDIDPDGYSLEVGQDSFGWGWHASANGKETYYFGGGPDGDHTVELGDVASNCVVSGDNPRVVWISYPQTAKTTFEIQCTAIP